MDLGLEGKVAMVTGGSRGIGAAIAMLLLEAGCEVAVTATTEKSLACFRERVSGPLQEKLKLISCDFEDEQQVKNIEVQLHQLQVDILINCAGINQIGLAENVSHDDFSRIQKVNVTAPFRLCKAAISGMAARNWGRIVNITSIFGTVSKAHRISYSTSKFALSGMTKALALDYASKGVLVNAVGPGVIETELTLNILGDRGVNEIKADIPLGRLGRPEEVAKLVVFLASVENGYITGQQIIIDGGYTCA
jgi:3-oxoacyl-[acyl-carrier protein] reductase